MNSNEKALIALAIKLIHENDDYFGGMDILYRLIGKKPLDFGEIRELSIKEIHEGLEQKFSVKNMNHDKSRKGKISRSSK